MSAAPDLDPLRADLEKRFGRAIAPRPGEAPARGRPGFRTGIGALDRLLPEGVPRGAVTLWAGEVSAGRTAALRCLVRRASAAAPVALVDATLALDPADWCGDDGGPLPGVWFARPPTAGCGAEGGWAAEALLRTGTFGLVVLDGPPPAPAEVHRLRLLAREADAALVVSTGADAGWRADVRLEFRRAAGAPGLAADGRFRRAASVRIARGAGARRGEKELELVHEPTNRLRPLPFEGDRRPAARE